MVSQHRRHQVAMLTGQLVRVAVQGTYFVVLARELEASQYGASAAAIAIASMLAPYSNLGSALLMLRNVSRDRETAPIQWANTVTLTLLSGGGLTVAIAALAPVIAPASVTMTILALIGISELICSRLIDSAGNLFQAHDRMGTSATIQTSLQFVRLMALVVLILSPWDVTVRTWAISYAAASLCTTLVIFAISRRLAGRARPKLRVYAAEWHVGILMSIGLSAQTVYNDVDKTFLANLSSVRANGIYSAAYRVVDMSYVPVRSFIAVAYPEMLRAGQGGNVGATLRVARHRILGPILAYCTIGTLGMIGFSWLLPRILGSSFEQSVPTLQLLSVLLLLKGAHYFAADTLTTSDHQKSRTAAQVGIAVLNVGLCLVLIPRYSYHGAVIASLISDGALAFSLWALIAAKLRTGSPRHREH